MARKAKKQTPIGKQATRKKAPFDPMPILIDSAGKYGAEMAAMLNPDNLRKGDAAHMKAILDYNREQRRTGISRLDEQLKDMTAMSSQGVLFFTIMIVLAAAGQPLPEFN